MRVKSEQKTTTSTALRVLEWLEELIGSRKLGPGEALPSELEIAAATKASRSSVREALTALKVFGIIRSRRKGGITITRDPVLLELRHFFVENYESPSILEEVKEFRAAMEWGFGLLLLDRITAETIQELKEIIAEEYAQTFSVAEMAQAEVRFHTILTEAGGNRLAQLFAHLYPPIFLSVEGKATEEASSQEERDKWREEHLTIVEALERRDEPRFLELLRDHIHQYMRWSESSGLRPSNTDKG